MTRRTIVALLAATAISGLAAAPAPAQTAPDTGPGGPVLVVAGSDNPFGRYYAEILRAEGLNEFAVADIDDLSPGLLSAYQVVVVADTTVSATQAAWLSGWVADGGNLIAMRPGATLAGLLGLGADQGDVDNGYIAVDPSSAAGAGITSQTMQYHGTADRWSLAGAGQVAALYSSATAAAGAPAVTLRSVGAQGGQAAAFTYDLARSVVLTRQGDPDKVGDDFDDDGKRSDDLFQPDWLDMDKVSVPQADEQQRLLANLITQMNLDRAPLPRFWYLPRGEEAAVVMTGDDHANGGTAGQFDHFKDESPDGCSVADWECVRATSYVYSTGSVDNATSYQDQGFEIGLHLTTGCSDYTPSSLAATWNTQLAAWKTHFPGITSPRTSRTHCITWSDWIGEPEAELAHGVRFDTNYYYYPASWVQDRPGMFTGSGFPMRFADTDGTMIDVYQAPTQITDESEQDIPAHIAALLDGALGPHGYYGVFTANMHTDLPDHPGANAIVAAAITRGVPVVSAAQMLDWIDGRNSSSFRSVSYAGNVLHFTVQPGATARGLEAMLPARSAGGPLTSLTRGGVPISAPIRRVKGIDYAVFGAAAGAYTATYGSGGGAHVVPETTITRASVSGRRAAFDFTGTGAGFQCRMDGAAFAPCASGQTYTGLASGGHSFQVRAIDAGGTPDPTPAERRFTVVIPAHVAPAARPAAPVARSAGRVTLTQRRIGVSRSGKLRLRVKCPPGEQRCRVKLRLRAHGKVVAARTFTVGAAKTRTIRLTLRRSARRTLFQQGTLRVTATAISTNTLGARTVTRKKIRLVAP